MCMRMRALGTKSFPLRITRELSLSCLHAIHYTRSLTNRLTRELQL